MFFYVEREPVAGHFMCEWQILLHVGEKRRGGNELTTVSSCYMLLGEYVDLHHNTFVNCNYCTQFIFRGEGDKSVPYLCADQASGLFSLYSSHFVKQFCS
jgi:hypothetical protein